MGKILNETGVIIVSAPWMLGKDVGEMAEELGWPSEKMVVGKWLGKSTVWKIRL